MEKQNSYCYRQMHLQIQQKKLQINVNLTKFHYKLVEDRELLGQAIGKEARVVVAVLDGGFAKKL